MTRQFGLSIRSACPVVRACTVHVLANRIVSVTALLPALAHFVLPVIAAAILAGQSVGIAAGVERSLARVQQEVVGRAVARDEVGVRVVRSVSVKVMNWRRSAQIVAERALDYENMLVDSSALGARVLFADVHQHVALADDAFSPELKSKRTFPALVPVTSEPLVGIALPDAAARITEGSDRRELPAPASAQYVGFHDPNIRKVSYFREVT